MLFWRYCRFLCLYRRIFAPAVVILCFRNDIDGPFVTQSITPIHLPISSSPSFVLQYRTSVILLRSCLHFFMLFSIVLFKYGSFFSDFILPFPFLIVPNRSLTINATAYNRLLQYVMLKVVMY